MLGSLTENWILKLISLIFALVLWFFVMGEKRQEVGIAVDLKDLKPGLTSFKRLDERLNIPSALRVTRLSPSFVDVRLERIKEKEVPVKVVVEGEPAAGYHFVEASGQPTKAVISGAESELKDVREVETDPVNITDVAESFSLMVPLKYAGKYTSLKDQEAVEVQVRIEADPPPAPAKKKASGKDGSKK